MQKVSEQPIVGNGLMATLAGAGPGHAHHAQAALTGNVFGAFTGIR